MRLYYEREVRTSEKRRRRLNSSKLMRTEEPNSLNVERKK